MDKVRIDKWLWSVRIFKSRSLATDACKRGNVTIGNLKAKPSSTVSVDDLVGVRKHGFNLQLKVVRLISKRVSATLAAPCYVDLTPEEELNKFKDWYVGKAPAESRSRGAGRPTKRERRDLEDFKDSWFALLDEKHD